MFFRTVAFFMLSVFVLSQGVIAAQPALTPNDVVASNTVLITQYHNLYIAVNDLSTSTPAPTVFSTSQTVQSRFSTIIDHLHRVTQAMQSTPPFTDAQAAPIVSSLADYVTIHKQLMATLIAKHPIFAQFALTAPIASQLRNLESSIDSFSFAMINLIPTRTSDVNQDKNALDTSIAHAINTYDEVCVPSPLYPVVMPRCVGQ